MSRSLFGVQRWQWNHWWARLGQDSDVPVRRNGAAPSNFDRVEPSRSRDAAFESFGKGKGFGGKGDAFGKGNWVEFSATFSMLQWSNSNQLHITIPFQICPFFPVSCLLFSSKHYLDPGKDGKGKGKGKEDPDAPPKEQPNFEPSGLLALEDNAKNGIPLKFTVPAEARRPATKWRLYVFAKQNEGPKMIHIYKNVAFRRPGRTFVLHFEVLGVGLWHAKTQ